MIEIRRLIGPAILPHLADIARLRIRVFREFPYLYDGSVEYEQTYLEGYASAARGVCVLALDDGVVVGASTGLPLEEADEAFQAPFQEAGIDLRSVFYFGESVLEKSHRGQGIGHRFFDEREAHAAELGFPITTFCAVERPDDHPLKPVDYRSNEAFWTKRGYLLRPDLKARLSWQQVDSPDEVSNLLAFRTRAREFSPSASPFPPRTRR
jgi:GNAT superfamily N-acetyltransferase